MTATEVTVIPTAPRRYLGGDWLKRQRPDISPFGHRVADMLGEWARGIYHISDAVLSSKSDFTRESNIEMCWSTGYMHLDTVDGDGMTTLVFLAHDYGIRVDIRPRGFRYMTFLFSQRDRSGSWTEGHPTLEQAVANWRVSYPNQEKP